MASNRALSIFETINNRGMSLENADIFKAKLYYKAKSQGHQEAFKMLWADFRHSTEMLKISVKDTGLSRNIEMGKYFNEAIINLVQLLIWFSSVQLAIDKNKKQLIVLDDIITSLDASNRS